MVRQPHERLGGVEVRDHCLFIGHFSLRVDCLDAIVTFAMAILSETLTLELVKYSVGQVRPRVAAASSSRTNQLATAAGSMIRPIAKKPH